MQPKGAAAIVHAFFLSLGQLGDRAILSVLAKSLALTLLLFVSSGGALWLLLDSLAMQWVPTEGHGIAAIATLLALAAAAWLLFRAIAVAVIGIFGDEVVRAVEARHYPAALAVARDVPFGRALGMALGSVGRTIGINLLLAPAYLALLITGIGFPALFFVANAWLLGRDLGDMVAARHLPRAELRPWRARTPIRRFALGAAGTALLLLPLINFIAPVLSAAMATHLFHRGRKA